MLWLWCRGCSWGVECPCLFCSHPWWRTGSSSSLGTLLYEVLPNWRNCMHSCRWARRGNWPQDTSKYIWPFIEAITNLEPYVVSVMHYCFDFSLVLSLLKIFQILLESRYKHDQYDDSLLSVDGMDFPIPERGQECYSFKFRKSGVRYEVVQSILGGEICWISGPHQPGVYNDVDIFRSSLASHLDPFERVEADDGYLSEAPLQVKCLACITVPVEKQQMMKRVCSPQEAINKQFK